MPRLYLLLLHFVRSYFFHIVQFFSGCNIYAAPNKIKWHEFKVLTQQCPQYTEENHESSVAGNSPKTNQERYRCNNPLDPSVSGLITKLRQRTRRVSLPERRPADQPTTPLVAKWEIATCRYQHFRGFPSLTYYSPLTAFGVITPLNELTYRVS